MGYQEQCIEEYLHCGDRVAVILHGGHWQGFHWIVDTGDNRWESQEEWSDRYDATRDVIAFLAENLRF